MDCIHCKRLVWQTRTLSNCSYCLYIFTWLCGRLTRAKSHIDFLPFTFISVPSSQLYILPWCFVVTSKLTDGSFQWLIAQNTNSVNIQNNLLQSVKMFDKHNAGKQQSH